MSDEIKDVMCIRCNSEMEMDPEPYAIPLAKLRGADDTTVSVDKSRLVRLFRCLNTECLYIELKVPTGWPTLVPKTA